MYIIKAMIYNNIIYYNNRFVKFNYIFLTIKVTDLDIWRVYNMQCT